MLFFWCTFNYICHFFRVLQGLSPKELLDTIQHGLVCHLRSGNSCSNVADHGWIFLISYVIFAISTVNFLSMCESAVFTVAATTVSLPLSGIWWSIYKMDVGANGGESTNFFGFMISFKNTYRIFLVSMNQEKFPGHPE